MVLYLQEHWRQLQDPHTAHYSQIEHCRWFPYDSTGNDSFTLEDSRIQIHPQFCNLQQTPRYRDYFWYRHTKEVFSFICLGQGKKLLYTKGWQIPHLHKKL